MDFEDLVSALVLVLVPHSPVAFSRVQVTQVPGPTALVAKGRARCGSSSFLWATSKVNQWSARLWQLQKMASVKVRLRRPGEASPRKKQPMAAWSTTSASNLLAMGSNLLAMASHLPSSMKENTSYII